MVPKKFPSYSLRKIAETYRFHNFALVFLRSDLWQFYTRIFGDFCTGAPIYYTFYTVRLLPLTVLMLYSMY